jgi:hypothetical protein
VTFKRLSASNAIIIHDQNSLRVTNVQMKKFGVIEDGTGWPTLDFGVEKRIKPIVERERKLPIIYTYHHRYCGGFDGLFGLKPWTRFTKIHGSLVSGHRSFG